MSDIIITEVENAERKSGGFFFRGKDGTFMSFNLNKLSLRCL